VNLELNQKLRSAVTQFWSSRETQAQKQGTKTGIRDAGSRTAVTGGSQMDGFVALVRDLLEESGIDRPVVYCERHMELPGWFRPEKKWDLLVVVGGLLDCRH
jgi:Restriction endonuclease XhoI